MKFWFCEKCNTRLTDEDLQAGRATEAGSQAVYCAACMKAMNPMASSAGDRKTGAVGRSTVVLAAKRPSASTARISGKPAAPTTNSGNSTLLMVAGGVLGIFGLLMIVLGGRRSETTDSPAVADRTETKIQAPQPTTGVKDVPASHTPPSPAKKADPQTEKRPDRPASSGLFSITFGGDNSGSGSAKTPSPQTPNPKTQTPAPTETPKKPANPADPVENLDALLKRAVKLEGEGKFEEALAAYDKGAKMTPDYPEIYSNRGNVKLNLRDFRGALADADHALQMKKFWNAYAVKAIAHAVLGQESEYRAALSEAKSLVNEKEELEAIIVSGANKLKTELAGKEFEGKQPQTVQEYIARAQFRIGQKRWRDAINDYDAVLKLDKSLGDKGVYAAMAELAGQDGDNKAKLGYYQQWLKASPNSAEAMNSVAWELLTSKDEKLRNPAAALPIAQKANELTQEMNPGILDTCALALHRTGRKADAIAMQKKAISLLPEKTPEAQRQEYEQHLKEFEN